jgi:Xaa-Pro dipeptidase
VGSPDSLLPTKEEIARRLSTVAALAKAQGIDSIVVLEPAHIFYLSGFRTTLYTRFMGVALRTDAPEEAMLIATAVDKRLTEQPVWYPSLLERTEIYYRGAPPESGLIADPGILIDKVVRAGDTVGIDLHGASYGNVEMILGRQPDLTLRDATPVLHAARSIKSEVEIAAMTRANQIAVDVLGTVPSLLHTGMTERELGAALDGAAKLAGSDGNAYPTLIGFGPKSLAPHAPPTARALEPNSIVCIAYGPMAGGYCADIVRTFYYGTPPEQAVRSGERGVEIQAAALAQIRAGARAGSLADAAGEVVHRYYPNAPKTANAGHSLGLTVHEEPSLLASNDQPLESDMIIAIEPGAPAHAMEGIGLYRHCDVVRVTNDGYELLTPLARGLVVVPLKEGDA